MTLKKENRYIDHVVVIGGGPAGMMAALQASLNHKVLLIERNKELGKKLLLTGGGRCNITFKGDEEVFYRHVYKNPKFMIPSFSAFNNRDTLDFFKGISFKEEGEKIYPVGDAHTIRDFLLKELEKRGVKILYEATVKELYISDEKVQGFMLGDTCFLTKHLILATGGGSYPGTGSDGKLLKTLPLGIEPFSPVLVGLYSEEDLSELSGITLKATLTYKKKKHEGEILFTHHGLSGPLIFHLSSIYDEKKKEIYLDFLENFSKEALERILFKNKENPQKVLSPHLPKKLFIYLCGDLRDRFNASKEEREELLSRLKSHQITIKRWGSLESAIVSRGGVSLKEVDPKTMKAKHLEGLSLCGEMLNLDGATGGYNLQIAFSTGFMAGRNL